ncbi:2Fe-2S iron-sulfur cluster binding domain-containing protein [Candidatus Peregrinibacteria bacterium]|nr:2Fe-2S iron-sulfur cluster binding domain-containing protein [Candidatus Peregrinibacteria bacterium]
MKSIHIYIDREKLECTEEQSVLEVAIENDIEIPHFCYHEDLPIDANCRTCLVEIEESKEIVTSCTLKATDGLKVQTNSTQVKKLRDENLELLLSDHKKYCKRCSKGHFCKTHEIMKRYKITGTKYRKATIDAPIHKMGNAAEYDPQTCINCNKCVEMCEKIGISFLRLKGKGATTHIEFNDNPNCDCIYCGQCTVHCPVTAISEQSHLEHVEEALKDKNKIVIGQMAPSIRTSIGEEFGLEVGKNLTKQMYTAMRKLGFNKIFDVNMGADITTWVEAKELVERIKEGGTLPMFTSCCPGWVKFLEFYYPDMISHLTTARSPQIHSGGAYKTWWAEKEGIDPKNIVVVSFMPCTSKKYEAHHDKLRIDGMYPVDYVLTTRETGVLLKKNKIDLPNLKPSEVDKYGEYTGAGAIYGASGGVMESALRSASHFLTGEDIGPIEFKPVRGMEKVKKADVKIGDKTIKVAVVATAAYARIVLEQIKKDPSTYDYIEFMACPGGCIGGGGQPIPSTERIIAKRIEGLYGIDEQKKIRRAHLNPVVQEFFNDYIDKLQHKRQEEILHTTYSKKKKFE